MNLGMLQVVTVLYFLPCMITHAEKIVKRLFDIHLFHFKLFISSSNLNKYM